MRETVVAMQSSRIREVANAALKNPDVLAFWFGESDEVTPLPVREAAAPLAGARRDLLRVTTSACPNCARRWRATWQRLHGAVSAERIAVTSSGVNALMLAMQLLAGAGDEVVAVVPVWPNLTAQPAIMGARVRRIALAPDAAGALAARPATRCSRPSRRQPRVLLVNAPNNPTGWTLTRDEQQAMLAHCRRTGTWIVADEVYERLYFGDGLGCAPSFLDIASARRPADRGAQLLQELPDDRLAPGLAGAAARRWSTQIGKLIEFNTSCAPVFVQRGGLAALRLGDDFVPALVQRLQACRDLLLPQLAAAARRRRWPCPTAACTPSSASRARTDSLALAKRLVAEHGLGPGARRRLRAGGRGLAALVLRLARPAAADAGRGQAGSGALGL